MKQTDYKQLLKESLEQHDPTLLNRQGRGSGTQLDLDCSSIQRSSGGLLNKSCRKLQQITKWSGYAPAVRSLRADRMTTATHRDTCRRPQAATKWLKALLVYITYTACTIVLNGKRLFHICCSDLRCLLTIRSDHFVQTYMATGTIGANRQETNSGRLRGDQEAVASMINRSWPRSGVDK